MSAVTNDNISADSVPDKHPGEWPWWIAIKAGTVLLSAVTALLISALVFCAYVVIAVSAHSRLNAP